MRRLVVVLGLAVGCGGSDGSGSLVGGVEKGPFVAGSSVDVAVLDATFASTGQVFSTQTVDHAGRFEIQMGGAGAGAAIAIEGTGFYYNEVTGLLSTAPITLRALDTNDGGHEA